MRYFVWTLRYEGALPHIERLLEAQAEETGVAVRIGRMGERIVVSAPEDTPRLSEYIASLASVLPAALFLEEATYRFEANDPLAGVSQPAAPSLPLAVAPCPRCQKEMFDVASRRYYYPFTSCNACGAQTPFVEAYPYTREHTAMRFFVPCEACREEAARNPFRRDYPLISCIECGIAMKMTDAKSERFANTKGEYRRLFEVAARAIAKGKRVLVKTLFGYRLFFLPEGRATPRTRLMVCDANAMNALLTLVPQEFHALLSIERPMLRVTLRDETLKTYFGASAPCKFADEGVSMLLARELLNAGHRYVAYEEADETTDADYRVEFDVPVRFARDTELFVNQDARFFARGTRAVYPRFLAEKTTRLCVLSPLAAVPYEGGVLIDDMERFETVAASEAYVAEGDAFVSGHSQEVRFSPSSASLLSVLFEHGKLRLPAVGIYLDEAPVVMYYNGIEVKRIVAPMPLQSARIFDEVAALRDGSARLVARFKERFFERAKRIEACEGCGMLDIAAAIIGLDAPGAESLSAEALRFYGKGGTQVDTRIREGMFDTAAFYASLMSYALADADRVMLSYSIYESLGDFIGKTASEAARETGCETVAMCGEGFANQAIFGRLMRQMGHLRPLFAKTFPVNKEGALAGALYLP